MTAAELAPLVSLVRAWLDSSQPGARVRVDSFTPATFALAESQRVSALLYDLAQRADGPGVAAMLEATRPAYYRTLLRNDALLESAALATRTLVNAGIPVLRLKGADLLLEHYASHALRPMDDVDLLVPRVEAERAVAALERAGFKRAPGQLPLAQVLEHHFHLPLADPAQGTCLELHWELMDRYKRGALSGPAFWSHAQPVDAGCPELGLRLDPEMKFLHLALHLSKHAPYLEIVRARCGAAGALTHPSSEARLLWLVDLALVARKMSRDGSRLEQLARSAGVERAAAESLAIARDLLGEQRFPSGCLEIPPSGPWRRLVAAVTAQLLIRESAPAWLERAGQMDETAQVRPLRLLELPLLVFPPFSEFRREHALGRMRALFCYPRHVAMEISRIVRFAWALIARRRAERAG